MKSLKRIHIGHVYMKSLKRMCYMKSLKRIHRTCLYEEFEENTCVYMKSLKRIHRTCLYEEFEENT